MKIISSNFGDKSTFLKSTKRFEPEFAKPALTETLRFLHLSTAQLLKTTSYLLLFDKSNGIGEVKGIESILIVER